MKHYITISVIAAAALASCTQTEDFTSQYNEKAKTMKFDVAYVGKNTRAATGDLTTENLGDQNLIFWCDAYSGSTTPGTTTTGLWISKQEPLYLKKQTAPSNYWDVFSDASTSNGADVQYPGSSYTTYFTAIAPQAEFVASTESSPTTATYSMTGQYSSENASTPPTFGTRKLTLDNIPVVQEVVDGATPKGVDYLIACATSTTEEVALEFKHLLSKLRFAVWTDESTAQGNDPTTKIELNYLKIYLPNTNARAEYVQKAHNDYNGDWKWSGFTAVNDNPSTTGSNGYQLINLTGDSEIIKEVSAFASPVAAHGAEWNKVKLDDDKQFFIAPTESTTPNASSPAKIFIDIKYTVKRKVEGKWSTTDDINKKGTTGQVYSAGHKVVTRTNMLVPVGDGSLGHGNETDADADVERNEGLSHFHQGTLETLYICLRADQLVKFDTTFDVNGWYVDKWQDDPIDIKQ